MKISLNWLNEYVDVDLSAEQVVEILSNLGFPNEGISVVDGDSVIDLEVTSNRGDCLSHIGVARELAAATGKKLRIPKVNLNFSDRDISEFVDVRIEHKEGCGRYTARAITGVKVGPTPDWMRKRLEAIGLRSVNNVVDATNYAMMEIGQPPHAFDYDKLTGKKIIIRKAKPGEQIISIDQTQCKLAETMLVIADPSGPVAVAGVMGGLATEINDATTTVLLEEAHFDPITIRSTARRLSLSSEASFRFERQVDIEMIDFASQRCAELIVMVAGGQVAKGIADDYSAKPEAITVGMRLTRVKKLLGIEVPRDRGVKILSALGLQPESRNDELVVCTIPSWRHDLYREADLIEEIARCHGYDKIPVEKRMVIDVAVPEPRQRLAGRLRNFLNGCGYFETINVTFVEDSVAQPFEDSAEPPLRVLHESRKLANQLRRSLIGPLVQVVTTNHHAGNRNCRFYELADTFRPAPGAELPNERPKVAMVCEGEFRDIRGTIEGLVTMVHSQTPSRFEPVTLGWASAAAKIFVGEKEIGIAGNLAKPVLKTFDLEDSTVCAAEIDFLSLLDLAGKTSKFRPIPRFPSIARDLSLILDEPVRWAQIVESVRKQAPAELQDVIFVGIYRGKPIPAGKKSLTLSLQFRDEQGTLQHETVDGFEKNIVAQLTADLGAGLRTA